MKLSTLSRTPFHHSAEAINQVSRVGEVTRPNFKEAYEAPQCKDTQIEHGKDPLSLWIEHLGLSDGKAARFMGVTKEKYRSLKNDKRGAFLDTTPEMVISFCRRIKVHPAHLGSLDQSYMQSLPPYVTAANMLIASNPLGEFGEGDTQLATYALRVERARFTVSFQEKELYADVALVLGALKADDLAGVFNFICRDGKLTSDTLETAGILGEHILEREKDRLASYQLERDRLGYRLSEKYLDMCNRLSAQDALLFGKRESDKKAGSERVKPIDILLRNLIKTYVYKQLNQNAKAETPKKSDVRYWVSRFYDGLIREDYNRMLCHLGMHKEIGKWKVSLDDEIKETTEAIYPYLKARTEFSKRIGGLTAYYQDAQATVDSIENWLSEIQAQTREGQILQRLFANHMIMMMADKQRNDMQSRNVWTPDPR